MSPNKKVIIGMVAGVMIGIIIGIPLTLNFENNAHSIISTVKTPKSPVDENVIKQSDGLIINKTLAKNTLINMLIKKNENVVINQTTLWVNFGMNNELPSNSIPFSLFDNTNQVYIFPDWHEAGKEASKMTTPDFMKQTFNETISKMQKEFNEQPFILTKSYGTLPRITNTTISTITGKVVFDSNLNQVIVLGDGTKLPTDHLWQIGSMITLNKVKHDNMCALDQIKLSNGTVLTDNLQDISSDPEKYNLLSYAEAKAKWGDWANQDWVANDGCNSHEFITWELVSEKNE